MRRTLLVVSALGVAGLVGLASALGGGAPARASCVGPTIEHTAGTIGRGQALQVEGRFWGPFDGVGECGQADPLEDIEVVVVQDGVEHPLATVDADADFAFVVQAPLPADLEPGLADVRAHHPAFPDGGYDATAERLVVSREAPVAPVTTSATRSTPTTVSGPSPVEAGSDRDPVGVAVAIIVTAALLVATAVLFSRQRAPR